MRNPEKNKRQLKRRPKTEVSKTPRTLTRRRAIQLLAAGTATVLGYGVLRQFTKEQSSDESRPSRSSLSHKESEEVLANLPVNLVEIANNYNFDVLVQVANGTGPYILHIGQTHRLDVAEYRRTEEEQRAAEQQVIAIQSDIAQLLLHIQDEQDEKITVFDEATSIESLAQLQQIHDCIPQLRTLQPNETGWKTMHELYKNVFNQLEDPDEDKSLYVRMALNYVFVRFLEEKLKDLSNSNQLPFDKNQHPELFALYTTLREPLYHLEELDAALYFFGAAQTLFLHDRVGLAATHSESDLAEKGSSDFLRKQTEFVQKWKDFDPNTAPLEEIEKYLEEDEEMKRLRDQIQQQLLDGREDITIGSIHSSAPTSTIIPLVYGAYHDFENNIKNHNTQGGQSYGLITLIHKK